jgi:predicted HAD superfamily phosphohydrolase
MKHERVNRVILSEKLVIISSKSVASVSIRTKDEKTLLDRNYLFQSISRELNLESIDEILTHMMNVNFIAVQICNSIDKSVVVSRKSRLDRIIEYEEHECYATDSTKTSLATSFS